MAEMPNREIAAALDELGDLYELDGAISHRVLAYRNGAKAVREATRSVGALAVEGKATELPGIGATLQEKIAALVTDGEIPARAKLLSKYPMGLLDITRLPGVGPKRVRLMFTELGIDSLASLKTAAEAQQLRDVKGLGPKFEESVLAALAAGLGDKPAERALLSKALAEGDAIVAGLRAHPSSNRVELAGSARRLADTVKDLDVIATADDPAALTAALGELPEIESAGTAGENAAKGRTHSGLSIDLRVVEPDQFGNLLQHFTGSARHNVRLRENAVKKGFHVSEYGILDDATGETLRCATEEEVYAKLGLPYIEPELREDRGELDPGFTPPALVRESDLKGDLHCHTVASDGRNTIEEMAAEAIARGYEYLAITDHSATHGFGNHVDPDMLKRQIERVRTVNAKLGDELQLLIGTETNILPDGSPDYDDALLAELDWCIASVHTAFQTPRAEMTKRMVAAAEHPWIDAIGHPSGRKLGRRPGYDVDLGAVIEAAAKAGTMLEINGAPDRRDLDDVHAKQAAEAGVLILLDSDAHGTDRLANVRWAVATARRAWLTADAIANTKPWPEFAKLRKRAKNR
ncbi:MAG: DNA polymerase/3'-5' exonuclease PolX [Solirubrobacteraceae bacterium]|nr:DNA polymerase/3'-5' exonuclease PolX [Solirubrobacteraceae bacterium]